ncbi:hypothetical protein Lal_00022549 [Lupinus albus]|nr:hypothetical protein Lal_00022549 [Lupinus albus]
MTFFNHTEIEVWTDFFMDFFHFKSNFGQLKNEEEVVYFIAEHWRDITEMEEELNVNNETLEGLDDYNGSEEENVNEIEGLDFEEIDFRLLNEDEVKKYRVLNNEIAYKFYKMYGMKKGFGIRKYHIRRDKDGEILWQSFFCDIEGFRDKKNDLIRKRAPRKETRCGCLARMKIHIDKEKGDWYVSYFVDEHNHELVGEYYGAMITSNRRMTETDVAQMNTMREVDGCSIFDYSIFGDVLTFDATYGRNKYKFPLVIFSGVNHHKQTTVFAATVVSNETEETYVWLLEKFLEAMNGKHPKCVITDGDLSMKNAIRRVFPEVHHRLCAWHICNNAGKNIKKNNFHKDFQKVMYADVEIEDFNMMWEELINKHGLHNNAWVA